MAHKKFESRRRRVLATVESFLQGQQDLLRTIKLLERMREEASSEYANIAMGIHIEIDDEELDQLTKSIFPSAYEACFTKQPPDLDCILAMSTMPTASEVIIAWKFFVETDLFILLMIEISSLEEFSEHMAAYMCGIYSAYCYTVDHSKLKREFYQAVADFLNMDVQDVEKDFHKGDGRFRDSLNYRVWQTIFEERSWTIHRMQCLQFIISYMKRSQPPNITIFTQINPIEEFFRRVS